MASGHRQWGMSADHCRNRTPVRQPRARHGVQRRARRRRLYPQRLQDALDSARNAMEVHAACGLFADRPIERLLRDAHHIFAPAGTSDVQLLRLAEFALGTSKTQWSQRLASSAGSQTYRHHGYPVSYQPASPEAATQRQARVSPTFSSIAVPPTLPGAM
ncbi:acyl-CoA dehydrogenase family protein [Mesorhizobium sp.]|uniref:acyl-CoA dehydrogenase family protein n=1 Tax=Mesorhizobium sp. TaxID=1871066 RepID=UPI00338E840D